MRILDGALIQPGDLDMLFDRYAQQTSGFRLRPGAPDVVLAFRAGRSAAVVISRMALMQIWYPHLMPTAARQAEPPNRGWAYPIALWPRGLEQQAKSDTDRFRRVRLGPRYDVRAQLYNHLERV